MQRPEVEEQDFLLRRFRAGADLAAPPGHLENWDVVVFQRQGDCRSGIVVLIDPGFGTGIAFGAPKKFEIRAVLAVVSDREPGLFLISYRAHVKRDV